VTKPIFLLTDFGLEDTYVGQMKAVLVTRAPLSPQIDLTHSIPPQDVRGGARAIDDTLAHLPRSAVILAVVDPGVGTDRRPLIVTVGDLAGVGPDNGVLTPLLRLPGARAHAIDPQRAGAAALSSTFHGRDLFAPAAAGLATGSSPAELGEPVDDPVVLPPEPGPRRTSTGWTGRVVSVDRFGNLITNLRRDHLSDLPRNAAVELPTADSVPLVRTYGEAAAGELIALVGSGGFVEVACNGGSAAEITGLGVGDAIELRL